MKRLIALLVMMFSAASIHCGAAFSFVFEDKVSTAKSIAHYMMGQIYEQQEIPEAATLEYEKASEFDAASYLIRLRLGLNYARLNMLPEAKEQLRLVQQYNPQDLQSHYILALIFSAEKDYDAAALEYEFILKELSQKDPGNPAIHGYLAQFYYSQRKFDQATLQYEKILELDPKNTDVMYLLGSLYFDQNNPAKAIKILQDSLEVDPDHDGSLNTLGFIYAEQGENLEQALDLVNRALKIDPDNGAYLDSLGWVYYKKEMYKEALEALLKADSILKDPVIKNHLGDVYLKLNRISDAVELWESSLKLLPGQTDVTKKLNEIKNSQASN